MGLKKMPKHFTVGKEKKISSERKIRGSFGEERSRITMTYRKSEKDLKKSFCPKSLGKRCS